MKHLIFQEMVLDLYYHKNISLKQALCGFKFNIQYLNNENYYNK